ncbi:MAG TPA: hypothetical protein VHY84_06135 [Bryobacteraceae bacterium]|jgi:hypothetical protein|nr:hypothetical protein [Bryobacteraceae bacterium]
MRRLALMAIGCILIGCGSPPEKKAEAPPPPPPVKDDTALLLPLNRTSAKVVPNHLLGKDALPGGAIGDYDANGLKYQLFIIETDTAQDAAILLLDLKATLKDPAYIAYMGGYFGTDASGTVYVFAKAKYLAGVVGLAEDQADPIARQLAARLY